MKKYIALILVLVLCLSLCACGGSAKLTAGDVKEALADCDGTLNVETSGDNVTSFTYVVEGVNADDLVDKEYSRNAIATVLTGDSSKITLGHLKVSKAISPLMSIDVLLGGNEDDFNSDAFVDKILGIICDGKTAEYNGWTVSATVDQDSDSITILVISK